MTKFWRSLPGCGASALCDSIAIATTSLILTESGVPNQQLPRQPKLLKVRAGPALTAIVRDGVDETLSYMDFPREHWTRIRTNNVLERIMREIRRRTRVVGNFPDGKSAVRLVAARLRHIAGTRWGKRVYLDMERLRESAASPFDSTAARNMGENQTVRKA